MLGPYTVNDNVSNLNYSFFFWIFFFISFLFLAFENKHNNVFVWYVNVVEIYFDKNNNHNTIVIRLKLWVNHAFASMLSIGEEWRMQCIC